MSGLLRLRRVYEAPDASDGVRILVDRLWPRGVTKANAAVDAWIRDLAPSDALRRWYGHDPQRWEEFRRRYRAELADGGEERLRQLDLLCGDGPVTLLFAAADVDRNNAVVLKEALEERRAAGRSDPMALADARQLGRMLLEGAAEAIVCADRTGIIRFWNRGAERMFGHAAEEALGRSLDIIIPEPQRARHWAGYRRVIETGETEYADGRLLAVPGIRRDGSRISIEFTVTPIRNADGGVDGFAAVLRDVTQRFEELRRLRRALAAQGAAQDDRPVQPTGRKRAATQGE